MRRGCQEQRKKAHRERAGLQPPALSLRPRPPSPSCSPPNPLQMGLFNVTPAEQPRGQTFWEVSSPSTHGFPRQLEFLPRAWPSNRTTGSHVRAVETVALPLLG